MSWFAQAPSNIALIKYMGKQDEAINLPDNPSLSYTLNNLLSMVSLETQPGKKDVWERLEIPGALPFNLPDYGQTRYLQHLMFLKNYFNYQGGFIVRSANNFPHSAGFASSASSFAALTKCACTALSELTQKPLPNIETQAQLSRQGSGSSCRSFFAPWALWEGDRVNAIDLPYPHLIHQAVIIAHGEKNTLSRNAHQLVKTSPFYKRRPERAREHLRLLIQALQTKDWTAAFNIVWREFHDMHQLFETSNPPFTYFTAETKGLLATLHDFWEHHQDGPLVTMDAGSNIHLLYRDDQNLMAQQFKQDHLVGNFDVL